MNNLESIKKATIEASKKLVESQVNITFEELKTISKNFLVKLIDIYNSGEKYRVHSSGDHELMRLWTIYRDKQTSQALALLQNNFALALDSFLGRKIILTYVNKDGQLLLYTEEGEMQILQKVTKNTGRANFSMAEFAKAERIKELPAEINPGSEEDLISHIDKSAAGKATVYSTGRTRYWEVQHGKIHDKITRRYYYERRNDPRILNFPDSGFSMGEMAEAYANVVVLDDQAVNNDAIEFSLEYMYDNYIKSKKDNIAAIIKGDVSVGNSGRISLAVKGQSASTAKIGQYIVAAHYITTMPALTQEELAGWLENIPKIDEYAKKVEDEAIDSITFEKTLENIKIDVDIL